MEDDIALQEIPFLQISGGHDCEVEKCEANTSSDHVSKKVLLSDAEVNLPKKNIFVVYI